MFENSNLEKLTIKTKVMLYPKWNIQPNSSSIVNHIDAVM